MVDKGTGSFVIGTEMLTRVSSFSSALNSQEGKRVEQIFKGTNINSHAPIIGHTLYYTYICSNLTMDSAWGAS